jgi:hypothetical protein
VEVLNRDLVWHQLFGLDEVEEFMAGVLDARSIGSRMNSKFKEIENYVLKNLKFM